ncbi:hypothetical protein GCM10007880_58440 [Mesorhizobium amorphae]|nr:hypothetical protein GCM10007880_58440 [Mesorhizobium amorphae]
MGLSEAIWEARRREAIATRAEEKDLVLGHGKSGIALMGVAAMGSLVVL